jgi:hypothetical protein
MDIGATGSLEVVGMRGWQMIGPWTLLLRGPPNQIKRSPQPLDSYMRTVFLLNVFDCTYSMSIPKEAQWMFLLLRVLCLSLQSFDRFLVFLCIQRRDVQTTSCGELSTPLETVKPVRRTLVILYCACI